MEKIYHNLKLPSYLLIIYKSFKTKKYRMIRLNKTKEQEYQEDMNTINKQVTIKKKEKFKKMLQKNKNW